MESATSVLLKRVADRHDEVELLITKLNKFVGKTSDLAPIDLAARTAWIAYIDELEAAESRVAQGIDQDGPFVDVLSNRLSELRAQSKEFSNDLRAARRGARTRAEATDRESLLTDDGEAAIATTKADDAAQVTAALRSTRAQLNGEVDVGMEALRLLAHDKAKLKQVNESMSGMQTNLGEGHGLLDMFKKKDFIDNLWIGGALLVYIATVCWILYRRLGIARILGFVDFVLSVFLNFGILIGVTTDQNITADIDFTRSDL